MPENEGVIRLASVIMSIRSYQEYTPSIDQSAYLDESATIIGDVDIAKGASIWPNVVARGDVQSIQIGKNTNIQDGSIIHVTHESKYAPDGFPTIIGNSVTVGHRVLLHGCEIQDHCLIGMGSIIMDGAFIESFTLLGAGSLVPPGKILEGGHLWHGNPVTKVRALAEDEINYIKYSAKHYCQLAKKHTK